MLEPRPRRTRERAGSRREALVERARAPAERNDLLARDLERRHLPASLGAGERGVVPDRREVVVGLRELEKAVFQRDGLAGAGERVFPPARPRERAREVVDRHPAVGGLCELLLERWRAIRNVTERLSGPKKLAVLKPVAWTLMQRGATVDSAVRM